MEFLNKIKQGDKIVRNLHGGGYITGNIVTVEHVDSQYIYLQGCDGDYNKDSVYAFSNIAGVSVNNVMSGWFSQLIRLATQEDLENMEEC